MRVHRPDGPVAMVRMVMVQDDHGRGGNPVRGRRASDRPGRAFAGDGSAWIQAWAKAWPRSSTRSCDVLDAHREADEPVGDAELRRGSPGAPRRGS